MYARAGVAKLGKGAGLRILFLVILGFESPPLHHIRHLAHVIHVSAAGIVRGFIGRSYLYIGTPLHASMTDTALITGASGGIGLEMTRILAKEGYDIIAVARRTDMLEKLKGELESLYGRNVTVICSDLSEDGDVRKVFEIADKEGIEVDILVNNAGFGDYGPFAECDWDKQDRMIRLNVLALSHLTRLFLPGMISRGKGRILNTASVASFEPGPLMSVYYATKAYVLSFSEALTAELKGTGVTVTALCPGPTNTGFAKTANADGANVFKESTSSDARAVAMYGYRCMMKGKAVAIHGITFKAMVLLVRIFPRSLVRRIVLSVQRRSAP